MKKLVLTFLCVASIFATTTFKSGAQNLISQTKVEHAPAKSAADPWLGTWKMDVSQSKLHGPAPKEEILVIEAVSPDHIKYSIKSVGQTSQYTLTYDGKPDSDSPVMMDDNPAGTATYHRVTNHEYSGKARMGKSLTTTETIRLSPDKKKTTVKIHAKDGKGEYDEIAVYTR
jgi:hypothetical protein